MPKSKKSKLTEPKTVPSLDSLFHEVGTYKNSREYMNLLKFIRKFPRYAPYNAHLLYMQKPGCHYVAMASTWERDFKRTIKLGARPLIILVPFGPVGYVFDLDDTEGKPVPDDLLQPFKVEGSILEECFNRFMNNLPSIGIRYVEADYGSQMAGKIETCKRNPTQIVKIKKQDVRLKVLYNIYVNKNHSINDIFPTMVHELGHLFCGHLGEGEYGLFPERQNKNKNEREFEAESVAWLVCERIGIKNSSAKYLSDYLENNDTIPNISIDNVFNSAGRIEAMLQKRIKPNKEIIINE